MKQKKIFTVKNVTLIAMFSALAAVLETIQVPVPFAPPFYKLDFAELPVLIGGFAMGPVPAVLIAVVKNLLKMLINGTSTYYVGELGNIIGSCMFSVPAALIYSRHKTKRTAMIALAVGVVCAVLGAIFVNCFITLPFYAKVAFGGMENIIAMGTKINPAITNLYMFALLVIVPFNLLKCSLNAIVTTLVYKHVSVIIHSVGSERHDKTSAEKG